MSVAAVSSNFGEGGIYSTFGAADAIDWDPPTEWSSASDGDTAQVNSFQVATDRGKTYGPFTVNDATTIYRFDT